MFINNIFLPKTGCKGNCFYLKKKRKKRIILKLNHSKQSSFILEALQKDLLHWYDENHRSLPWRDTRDPYKIWLSEIILQQTRVEQGLPYYLHFIETYPTVQDLASAKEEQLMKSWEGLGYYSRARNLHFSAKYIVYELNGQFPKTHEGILKLKGVGPYTAAAIASFAYQIPVALVDGNVYRVLSRLFAIEESIDETIGKKVFQSKADEFLNKQKPDDHNQALMELGAMVCTPKNPQCDLCPFQSRCPSQETWTLRPVRTKKVKVRNRYFDFFLFLHGDEVLIEKRNDKDIWASLNQFPLIESPQSHLKSVKNQFQREYELVESSEVFKHILTHQRIYAKFHVCRVQESFETSTEQQWIPFQSISKLAFPKLILNYLETYSI